METALHISVKLWASGGCVGSGDCPAVLPSAAEPGPGWRSGWHSLEQHWEGPAAFLRPGWLTVRYLCASC